VCAKSVYRKKASLYGAVGCLAFLEYNLQIREADSEELFLNPKISLRFYAYEATKSSSITP